jgi:hypothetical protein
MTAEQVVELLGEQVEALERRMIERVEKRLAELRADLLERLLELRAPNYNGNAKGELYIDGRMVIDFRPLFRELVNDALKVAKNGGGDGEG